MPQYVAFLRAINVGGRTVKNTELQKIFAAAGIAGAETFIASGNVIFESSAKEPALTTKIEAQLQKSLGYEVRTFLRSIDEVAQVAEQRPFKATQHASAKAFVIGFVDSPFTAAEKRTIAGFTSPGDEFYVEGREVYWLAQTFQSESPFFKIPFDKRVRPSTWRNINTVQRIVAKYAT